MLESPKILIVDDDARTIETVVEALSRSFQARITCVAGGENAFDIDLLEPHDLAIAEVNLPVLDGLVFARRWRGLRPRPILLTSSHPTLSQAIEALRVGASDFFVKPFDAVVLVDSVRRALSGAVEQSLRVQRHGRLRSLVRRVIRERRELNQRIDLLCRDLVGAHRRLVHRVMDYEKTRA